MGGNPLQIAKLVDPHAQRDSDLRVELPAVSGIVLDQVIELRPVAQHAEYDFGCEPGIAGGKSGGVGQQKVGSKAALLHLAEDVEDSGAGGRDGHGYPKSSVGCRADPLVGAVRPAGLEAHLTRAPIICCDS